MVPVGGRDAVGTYTHNWNSGTGQWVLAQFEGRLYVAGRRVAPSDRLGSDLTGGLKLMPYGEEFSRRMCRMTGRSLRLTIAMLRGWIMRTSGITRRVRVGL